MQEQIQAQSNIGNISVSQNDGNGNCTCVNCAATDEREESHMGSLLAFINAVADAVVSGHNVEGMLGAPTEASNLTYPSVQRHSEARDEDNPTPEYAKEILYQPEPDLPDAAFIKDEVDVK